MPDQLPRHIPALDGLRGLAILLVLSWHSMPVTHGFFPGWAGVDLFFVLSGYLITGKLLATKDGPNYFLNFYRNRALRILPLYYAVLFSFLAVVLLFVQKQHLAEFSIYTGHWKSFMLFTQNWTFIFVGYPKNISLAHFWSLAIEEQFYLAWPVVILLTKSPASRIKLFAALIILVMLVRTALYLFYPPSHFPDHFNTFLRADSLIAGALLYQLHHAGIKIDAGMVKRAALLLLILIVVGLIATGVSPFTLFFGTVGYTVVALFFACVLHLIVVPGKNAPDRIFRWPFLRYCGKISYGLYILHLPIILLAGTKMTAWGTTRWPAGPGLVFAASMTICLLLAFLFSTLSFRWFESWFLRLKAPSPRI